MIGEWDKHGAASTGPTPSDLKFLAERAKQTEIAHRRMQTMGSEAGTAQLIGGLAAVILGLAERIEGLEASR